MHAVLIGCGKMGSAMAQAWLCSNLVSRLDVIDPYGCALDDNRVHHSKSLSNIDADICIIAVKPQILQDALKDIKFSHETLVLSIAAGQSLARLENIFGVKQPLIRSMPNTPAAIGKGISVSVANSNVSEEQKRHAIKLLEACGLHQWIDDESLMDAVTALSGSGPAYVFYLIEALYKAGKEVGLDNNLALTLARQTVIGSAALAESENDISASQLRENVTSPNGTTQAGLDILMDGRFDDVLKETLEAARKRSRDLNS